MALDTTITVAGLPVHYRAAGSGPPLILLHGWGGSSADWTQTIAALATCRTLIALDLPGFGITPALAERPEGERLADFVLACADQMGLARFDLNGHSFAANIAIHLAARSPERVQRLVLTCFSTFRNERERLLVDSLHRILALWMTLRRPWMARRRRLMRLVAGRFYYRVPADDDLLRRSFEHFLRMERRTALESAASAGSRSLHPAMRAIRSPALLIGARQDQIMPTSGTPYAAALIPGCRLQWIERCGHLPMIERPHVYHRVLEKFLGTPG
jgi:pimeloyl-ACP methyl ester carboxylesterase